MFALLALSAFFAIPSPMDMPRAEAFLVREGDVARLEDRYDRLDLWMTQAVTGRWFDDDGRMFLLAQLDFRPPPIGRQGTQTRADFAAERVRMPRVRTNAGFPEPFRDAIALLSPCATVDRPRSSRQLPHGYKHVYYWQHPTNYAQIVCSFLPERTNVWQLAVWQLAEGDDYPSKMADFEDKFLRKEFAPFVERHVRPRPPAATPERDLLRADARHSVSAYSNWHFSDATEFAVVDDLPTRDFVTALTNDFPRMRAKYAAALPTPLDGSNVLSVVRIYAGRDEYLNALEAEGLTNLAWSAAYWSISRRELVAHLSAGGEDELMRTIRHEAFHQYLSYAASMISASPWLNEGYAQYFEDEADEDWQLDFETSDETIKRMSEYLPSLLLMDYEQFYGGTDRERRMKYRLAWSVVRFLEKGADEVRLKPFAGLKERYMTTLLETHDMRKATSAAFKSTDLLKQFLAEWRKYWMKR